jgi:hypothetical protein
LQADQCGLEGEYHGHVRTLSELPLTKGGREILNALRKNGFIDKKGKLL